VRLLRWLRRYWSPLLVFGALLPGICLFVIVLFWPTEWW
jgi:hypothetical protein